MSTAKVREKGADFLRYLHGEPVADIGKDGKQTLAAVTRFLQEGVIKAIAEYIETTDEATLTSTSPGKKRKHNDTVSVADNLISVILNVIFLPFIRFGTKPKFPNAEGGLGRLPDKLCGSWFEAFYLDQQSSISLEAELPSKRIETDMSDSENEMPSTASPFTECLLFSPEFGLDQHLDILLTSADDERTRAVSDFCQVLLQVMIRWLANVSSVSVQRLPRSSEQDSFPEQTTRTSFPGWEYAWAADYRGNALINLEKKLEQLSLDVIQNNESVSISRLIPVVQASGAGKSRLADMYLHSSTALTFVGMPQRILLSFWASAMAIVSPRR
jgi:hypothetical protein